MSSKSSHRCTARGRRFLDLAAVGLLAAGSCAGAAAAPAPAGSYAGPVLPGLCVLDQTAVFNGTKVGTFANTHYQQMRDGAQQSVNAEDARIGADVAALKKQKLPQAQFEQRAAVLAKRYTDLRSRAGDESKRLDSMRQAMVEKISAAAQPIIRQAYVAHRCGLLLTRGSVLAGNPAMDITADVVKGMDAKITSIPLDQKVAASSKH